MLNRRRNSVPLLSVVLLGVLCSGVLQAHELLGNPRNWYSATANNTSPPSLTWSIVPDGTFRGKNRSKLIAELDHDWSYKGPSDAPLSERPWFHMLDQAFTRMGAVSGLSFTYEPSDDGKLVKGGWNHRGQLGIRGDVRVTGYDLSGAGQNAYGPGNGSIAIGTQLRRGSKNFNDTRFGLMHEIGHTMGLHHRKSPSEKSLMGGSGARRFEGPQFDDIRAFHIFYGDINERGGGNDSLATATDLGAISIGDELMIGEDARDHYIDMKRRAHVGDTDFLSIQNSSDLDVFELSLEDPLSLSLTLTPTGPTYDNRKDVTWTTSEINNLTLSVFNENGLIAFSDSGLLGESETLDLTLSDGPVWLQVNGTGNGTQMYELSIQSSVPEPSSLGFLVAVVFPWSIRRRKRSWYAA